MNIKNKTTHFQSSNEVSSFIQANFSLIQEAVLPFKGHAPDETLMQAATRGFWKGCLAYAPDCEKSLPEFAKDCAVNEVRHLLEMPAPAHVI